MSLGRLSCAVRTASLPRRRGSVLVHVLILSILVAYLSSIFLKFVLQQHTLGTQAIRSSAALKDSESSLFAVQSAWNLSGGVACSGFVWTAGSTFVSCTNAPGTCNCTCSVFIEGAGAPQYPDVVAALSGGDCQLRTDKDY